MLSKVREITDIGPMIFFTDRWPSGYGCSTYDYCSSSFQGTVTITVVPDGTVVDQVTTVTLPNPGGDYSLEGEWQYGALARPVQIRFQTATPTSTPGGKHYLFHVHLI